MADVVAAYVEIADHGMASYVSERHGLGSCASGNVPKFLGGIVHIAVIIELLGELLEPAFDTGAGRRCHRNCYCMKDLATVEAQIIRYRKNSIYLATFIGGARTMLHSI